MVRKTHTPKLLVRPRMAVCLLAVAAFLGLAEPLLAQATFPFTVNINESEDALLTGAAFGVMNGHSQSVHRGMPYIEVKNNSAANLIEFQLTIGDTDYHFSDDFLGAYAVVGKTTPDIDLVASATNDENRLVVMFGNGGLAQNEVARFKIDINADPGMDSVLSKKMFANPEWFNVLVDNPPNGQTSDNAIPFARFANSPNLVQRPPLPDILITNADGSPSNYYGGNYAPFGTMVMISHVSSDTSAVPEPTGALLALVGLMGLSGLFQRSRKHEQR